VIIPYTKFKLSCLLLLLLSANAFAQDTAHVKKKYPFDNDTLAIVKLFTKFSDQTVLAFETGRDAIIYVDENSIRKQAAKDTVNEWDYLKQAGKNVIAMLDSSAKHGDTIFIEGYDSHFERLLSNQVVKGDAMVYDKQAKHFVPVIFHRLERTLSIADRVFYFTGKRCFFRVQELIGVLPNEFMELKWTSVVPN